MNTAMTLLFCRILRSKQYHTNLALKIFQLKAKSTGFVNYWGNEMVKVDFLQYLNETILILFSPAHCLQILNSTQR